MRVIGFSKQKTNATILVDNKENVKHIFNGDMKYAKRYKTYENYDEYKGNMPIFVMNFTTDFVVHPTTSSAYINLVDVETKNNYTLSLQSITTFFQFILNNKIVKNEEGVFTGVFIPVKSGNVVFISMLDPDDIQLKDE